MGLSARFGGRATGARLFRGFGAGARASWRNEANLALGGWFQRTCRLPLGLVAGSHWVWKSAVVSGHKQKHRRAAGVGSIRGPRAVLSVQVVALSSQPLSALLSKETALLSSKRDGAPFACCYPSRRS